MGGSSSKNKSSPYEKDLEVLVKKMRLLQREIQEMMAEREEDNRAYEQDMEIFAMKEAEWKREKKGLRAELKRLRKVLEEKEEKIKEMEGEMLMADEKIEIWETNILVEHIKEERAARDETVQRWKKLYLAIKFELDDLIQRTHQGEGLYLKEEKEDMMEELNKELREKEETIEVLKARVVLMEKEEKRKARELDILRQSLRIICNKKLNKSSKCLSWNCHQ